MRRHLILALALASLAGCDLNSPSSSDAGAPFVDVGPTGCGGLSCDPLDPPPDASEPVIVDAGIIGDPLPWPGLGEAVEGE